jgi:hypothetical protein
MHRTLRWGRPGSVERAARPGPGRAGSRSLPPNLPAVSIVASSATRPAVSLRCARASRTLRRSGRSPPTVPHAARALHRGQCGGAGRPAGPHRSPPRRRNRRKLARLLLFPATARQRLVFLAGFLARGARPVGARPLGRPPPSPTPPLPHAEAAR